MGNSCAHPFPPPSTESLQSSSSGAPPTSEWVLMGVISTRELGTPERLKKLEEIRQRKTEHGETIVTSSTLALRNCYLSPSLSPIPLLPHSPLLRGIARKQPMLGHSMGALHLWEVQHKTKKQILGVWGDVPPENFGIFELPGRF